MQLNNGTFLIINLTYSNAKLAMWGTKPRDMGTTEEEFNENQLWQLKEDPKQPKRYYICNLKYDGYRINKLGPGKKDVGGVWHKGHYNDNQSWRFQHDGGEEI